MFLKKPALLFLFCFAALLLTAGTLRAHGPRIPHQADSLRKLLLHAKYDTIQIRLKYLLGERENIMRIAYWDSLRHDAHQHHLPRYYCRVLEKMAKLYYDRGNVPAATRYYTSGLKLAEVHGYKKEMIALIKGFEKVCALQLDRKKTLDLIYKGLKVAEELNDKKSMVDFYASLARYYLTSGEINKALTIHFGMLRLCKQMKYPFGILSALVGIGNDYALLDQHNKSVPYYLESKKYIHCVTEPVYLMQIYTSASVAFATLKQNDSAYFYADKAYKVAEQSGNKRALASALTILVGLHYDNGDRMLAKKYALQAMELAKASGFTAQIPSLSYWLKEIYQDEGNYKAAMKIYELQVRTRDSLSGEADRKRAMEKEFAYNMEKKEHEYEILEQKSQIQALQLYRGQYLLFGLVVAFALLGIVTWILIRHNRLKTLHQRIHLEQKLLRSQMDPHFIFNSLNSIQQLVMKNRNEHAEVYLSKFSKLMRDLLENSSRESLTLTDEITMLHTYLELESLRFGSTFSYSLKTDERIETDNIQIPPLMIQPFVENAIWHGLLAKENNRMLEVSIEPDTDNTIRCTIDDNGVGRAAALQNENRLGKKSMGLDFVRQRINLVNEAQKIRGSVNITDKKDGSNQSLGTTVTVILPITLKTC